jgi:hypothetical protein
VASPAGHPPCLHERDTAGGPDLLSLDVAQQTVGAIHAKRQLADLRARSGLTTEQLIYAGRAVGWLDVPSLEPH